VNYSPEIQPAINHGQGKPYADLENIALTLGRRIETRALAVPNYDERKRLRLLRDVAFKVAGCLSGTGKK
jgi:hypothetical protein